ncbi:MAG: NYN domain-containing protein [Actinobacteria bacterium]|nr:NYN domain-containing protein [Actinomycetota bacterium]
MKKDLIIVDGYNFIFNCNKAKKISRDNLAYLRDRLISDLSQYKSYKGCGIIVVFDAKKGRNNNKGREFYEQIEIIYSVSGETADAIVEKLVHEKSDFKNIYVITSDYMQQKVVFKNNIYRKSIREFTIELNDFKKKLREKIAENSSESSKSFYSVGKRLDKNTKEKFDKLRENRN